MNSKPWEKYGLKQSTYYARLKAGKPLEAPLYAGCCSARASGLVYENPPEKLDAIKEKYKNGVTEEILSELFRQL